MKDLSSEGIFKVDDATLGIITETFRAYCCTEKETIETIGEVYRSHGYLCDPHTAVGMKAAKDYRNDVKDDVPTVVLSTASPYKFPAPVSQALGIELKNDEFEQIQAICDKTGVPGPGNLSSLRDKKVLHKDVVDRENILDYVLGILGIQKEA